MRKIIILFLCIVVVLLVAMSWITFVGLRDKHGKSDVGVVLGTTVYPNGEMSPFLKAGLMQL